MSKFIKKAIRGDFFSSDQLGEYAKAGLQGAGFGAATGAVAGAVTGPGELITVPVGAAGGALWGVGSKAAEDIAYALYSNEKKIAWLAGDLEDTINKEIVPALRSVDKELAENLLVYAQQYKEYIDHYVRDGSKDELSNNVVGQSWTNLQAEQQALQQQQYQQQYQQQQQMSQDYSDTTLDNEVQTMLSLQPQASVDTKFKKIAQAQAPARPIFTGKDVSGLATGLPVSAIENYLQNNANNKLIQNENSIKDIALKLKANKSVMTIENLAKRMVIDDHPNTRIPTQQFLKELKAKMKIVRQTIALEPELLDPKISGLRADAKSIEKISGLRYLNGETALQEVLNSGKALTPEGIQSLEKAGIKATPEELQGLVNAAKGANKQSVNSLIKTFARDSITDVAKNPRLLAQIGRSLPSLGAGLIADLSIGWTYDQIAGLLKGGNLGKIQSGVKKSRAIIQEIERLSNQASQDTLRQSRIAGNVMWKLLDVLDDSIAKIQSAPKGDNSYVR